LTSRSRDLSLKGRISLSTSQPGMRMDGSWLSSGLSILFLANQGHRFYPSVGIGRNSIVWEFDLDSCCYCCRERHLPGSGDVRNDGICGLGDDGSNCQVYDGKAHVYYPESDPWVTSCGGTTIGNVSGSSFTEVTWSDNGITARGQ